MGQVTNGFMVERSKKKVQQVNELEIEVMEQCQSIQEQIIQVRNKIQPHIISASNLDGFLNGSIDQYLANFDEELKQLRQKLDEDRKHWNFAVSGSEKFLAANSDLMKQLSSDFSAIFNTYNYYRYKPDSLKDLLHFGTNQFSSQLTTFRWPTAEDLKQLKIAEPLKLQAIITKSASNGLCPLTAIQLVFQNGIKSPLFDAYPSAHEPITIRVPDSPIVTISSKANEWYSGSINFVHKDGKTTVAFDTKYDAKCADVTREIPENHSIVGVYG